MILRPCQTESFVSARFWIERLQPRQLRHDWLNFSSLGVLSRSGENSQVQSSVERIEIGTLLPVYWRFKTGRSKRDLLSISQTQCRTERNGQQYPTEIQIRENWSKIKGFSTRKVGYFVRPKKLSINIIGE